MTTERRLSRRRLLQSGSAAAVSALLAGCGGTGGGDGTDNGGGDGNTIAVGPNNQYVFRPDKITVQTGDTVRWEFKTSGHNVCCWPKMDKKISIPDGATGFGTMSENGDKYKLVSSGKTFEHTFETTGTYTYVCIPHVQLGMIGHVVVE